VRSMESQVIETESLGQRLKRLRKERGYSQITLAEMSGVTDAWISQIEMGRAMPSAELINQFAQVLKVPVRELLQDEEETMEIVSRQKLIGVLLETNQPDVAEEIITGLQSHPELSHIDSMTLTVHLAECRYQQKRYDETLELLQPLISKLESENYHDAHFMAWIRNNIGKAFFQKQDFTNALYTFRKAFDYTARFVTFDSLAAKISYNVGAALRRVGKHSESIFYLERSQEYYQSNNDLSKLADTIFDQGIAYKNKKDYTRAAECFDQAKSIYSGLDQRQWSYKVQLVMASSVTMETDLDQAVQQLQECLTRFQETNDHSGLLFAHAKIALAHIKLRNFGTAYTHLQNGLDVLLKNKLHRTPEDGELHKALAMYHLECGSFTESIESARKAADTFAIVGYVRDQVESMQVAIASHEKLGEYQQALTLYQTCTTLLLDSH